MPIKYQKVLYYNEVLDISMPIMDGMEACVEIKKYLNEPEEEDKVPDASSLKIKLP